MWNPDRNMTRKDTTIPTNAGCVASAIAPLCSHSGHVQPLLMAVYGCGVNRANCRLLNGLRNPPLLAEPGPRSSQIFRVYVPGAKGRFGLFCWYEYISHSTCVAVPGITPSVGPTGYVLPLSPTAEIVRCVGVTMTEVMFQPNVTIWLGAIL